jgi:hypothetical protein
MRKKLKNCFTPLHGAFQKRGVMADVELRWRPSLMNVPRKTGRSPQDSSGGEFLADKSVSA